MEKNDKTIDVLRLIEQAISKLNARLNEIEARLTRIELMQQEKKTILEESRVPEKESLLGGRTFLSSSTGEIERQIRIPICDICGRKLEESFAICQECGRKLCLEKCAITFENRILCIDDLMKIIPLSKKAFKCLLCITNDVTRVKAISKLTHMTEQDVKESLSELMNSGFVTKKDIFIFSTLAVTDDGIEALCTYRQVYGNHEDVILFENELKKYLTENRM